MSFFLYNQDGTQAIARPHLDGAQPSGVPGSSSPQNPDGMPKYHTHDSFDAETNAPSSNFTYDFDVFKFYVRDSWEEVLSHDAEGDVQSGSVDALAEAFSDGCAVKVGIADLCSNLKDDPSPLQHEVFVEVGSSYYYVDQKLFIAGSHPVVRVKPGIPLRYESQGWDFGWLVLRTDGLVSYRRCDPYTLSFQDDQSSHGVRWFVR